MGCSSEADSDSDSGIRTAVGSTTRGSKAGEGAGRR